MTLLRDMSAKPLDWFLSDLPKLSESLLDTKEDLIDPVVRFMQGSQKAIYDQARTLVQDQEDNFVYVTSPAVDIVKALLTEPKPWQGNRLQQIRPQIDALQQAVDQQVAQERSLAEQTLTSLRQRLQGAEGFEGLSQDQKAQLLQPFEPVQQALARQKRIAMIRDQVRMFEDQAYRQLLTQLDNMLHPQPAPAPTPTPDKEAGNEDQTSGLSSVKPVPPQTARELRMVHRNSVQVAFSRPWLATEADVDEYLAQLRTALMKEIEASTRVQI